MKRTLVVTIVVESDEPTFRAIEEAVDRVLDAGTFQSAIDEDLIDHEVGGSYMLLSTTCHESLGVNKPFVLTEQNAVEAIREVLTGPQLALLTKLTLFRQTSPLGRLRGPWMRVANVLVSHKVAEYDLNLSAVSRGRVLHITERGRSVAATAR